MTLKEKQIAVITLTDLLSDLANHFGHPDENIKAVIEVIQEKIQQIQATKCSSTKDWIKASGDKLVEILTLLSEGKKLKVNQRFVYPPTPMMNVIHDGGIKDFVELTGIPLSKFGDYSPERKGVVLESLTISGYSDGISKKIEYVYANPQMNRLFAHLEDGTEEDYDWSILDIYSGYQGEYVEPVTIRLEFISYTDGIGKQVQGKEIHVSAEWDDQKVVDFILHNEHEHLDKDLMIVFPGGYTIMLQSDARDKALTEDHLSHIGG